MYPNPSQEIITLNFPEKRNYYLSVYQLNGSKVFETKASNVKTHQLNISALANGMYFVKIQPKSSALYSVLKIVKK